MAIHRPGFSSCALLMLLAVPARAEMSAEELAKLAQNPDTQISAYYNAAVPATRDTRTTSRRRIDS